MGRSSWCGSRVIVRASQAGGLRADLRRVLLELVEGQAKARHEGVHEVVDFGERHLLDGHPQGLLGLNELRVARGDLLEGLEVAADLVGGVDEYPERLVWRLGPRGGPGWPLQGRRG